MSKLILQNIADNVSFDSLSVLWQNFDLKRFPKEQTLFDFQTETGASISKCFQRVMALFQSKYHVCYADTALKEGNHEVSLKTEQKLILKIWIINLLSY